MKKTVRKHVNIEDDNRDCCCPACSGLSWSGGLKKRKGANA